MSELIARLERAFLALTKPMPVALPAPDRQTEIDALRLEVEQAKSDRQRDLAQQDLTRAALKSANDDVQAREATIAELQTALEQANQERDEARRTVGDQAETIEILRMEIDAANRAEQGAPAGPDAAAVESAALEAKAAVGGSLEYVAKDRIVEYAQKFLSILHLQNMVEGTDNANPPV